jgi:hypothetical protein
MASKWPIDPGIIDFDAEKQEKFLQGKNTVATTGSKLNDCINRFIVSILFEFLAASNAMVANKSNSVRR